MKKKRLLREGPSPARDQKLSNLSLTSLLFFWHIVGARVGWADEGKGGKLGQL